MGTSLSNISAIVFSYIYSSFVGTCANSLGLSRYYKGVETLANRNFQASSSFYPGKECNELAPWLACI